jgi:tetratricopeptide (TPR) repeat protein
LGNKIFPVYEKVGMRNFLKTFWAVLFFFQIMEMNSRADPQIIDELDELYFKAKEKNEYLEFQRAIKDSEIILLESLGKTPKNAELIWRLARNYFRLGQRNKKQNIDIARSWYSQCYERAERGTEIDSQSGANYYYKGLCLANLSLLDGFFSFSFMKNAFSFKSTMERAAELEPSIHGGGPHRALGVYYNVFSSLSKGFLKDSIVHLKKAVNLSPKHSENYYYLACTYYEDQSYLLAKGMFESYLLRSRKGSVNSDNEYEIKFAREMLKETEKLINDPNFNPELTCHDAEEK